MKTNNKSFFSLLAGILFIIPVLITAINLIGIYNYYEVPLSEMPVLTWLAWISSIAFGVVLLMNIDGIALLAVAGVKVILEISLLMGNGLSLVLSLSKAVDYRHIYAIADLNTVDSFLPDVMVLIAVILGYTISKKKPIKVLGFIPAALYVLKQIAYIVMQNNYMQTNYYESYSPAWFSIIAWILMLAAYVMFGLWYAQGGYVAPAGAKHVAAAVPKADGAELIMKYKSLLDAGVLTQEEFEEKKKNILQL